MLLKAEEENAMQYESKEAEMQYKDLRSRFLGMIVGCAIGEIVARESLVYVSPEDEEYERQIAEASGEKPKAVPKYESGKNTKLLQEASAKFLDKNEKAALPIAGRISCSSE